MGEVDEEASTPHPGALHLAWSCPTVEVSCQEAVSCLPVPAERGSHGQGLLRDSSTGSEVGPADL